MFIFDLLAAIAIAFGAFLGARQGIWRMVAGVGAVALGSAAGWMLSDILGEALSDLGVGYPGNVVLGFFLPFALVSVYTRYLAGLWLSRLLEGRPERDRRLGAVAGAMWMVFASGFAGRMAGLAHPAQLEKRDLSGGGAPAFVTWLARYPGAVGGYIYLRGKSQLHAKDTQRWSRAVECALDNGRVQSRARDADMKASATLRALAPRERLARKLEVAPPPLRQE